MIVQMAASNTLLQTMAPDALRGRVMSAYSMMFLGMAPFSGLLAGALAERIGAPATVTLGGAACFLGAAVFWMRLPALRAEGWRLILAQQAAGGEPAGGTTGEVPLERSALEPDRS
jgi:MFS family permease